MRDTLLDGGQPVFRGGSLGGQEAAQGRERVFGWQREQAAVPYVVTSEFESQLNNEQCVRCGRDGPIERAAGAGEGPAVAVE